jgi:hypothetical protein
MENKNKEILTERDEKQALKALADQEGGQIVIAAVLSDITRFVTQLTSEYRTGSHFDLVRICADLNASLSLYRSLTRAEKHVKEIDEIIKEALHED